MFEPAYEHGPDFNRARSQIATPFQYIDIALDAVTSNSIVNISGDFLYVDPSSTGVATLELNNQYNDKSAPFFIQSGFALQAVFKQVKLSWAAQAGKFIRLLYSTGDRVVPAFSAALNISGNVSVLPAGVGYGAAYKSMTSLGVNGNEVVFAPGANTGGAILWRAAFHSSQASNAPLAAFIAHTAAPGNLVTGDVIVGVDASTATAVANGICLGSLADPVRIPAGKGLYFQIGTVAEGASFRSALYTLL